MTKAHASSLKALMYWVHNKRGAKQCNAVNTYSRADLVHGHNMHTSFKFRQCQPPTQRLVIKTLQY